jgi:hypothetical protein
VDPGAEVYALVLLHSFFEPLQGFMNCLVFFRPQIILFFWPELETAPPASGSTGTGTALASIPGALKDKCPGEAVL